MAYEASTSLTSRAHTPPPSLPSWNSIRLNASTSPRSSSSITVSPIFSNASPYSPHSKTLWQLSQSEPSLVPDVYPSESIPPELYRGGPGPSSSSAKDRRRNTLHVDISISKLGHTRAVSDDDPVLTLGDSSLDTERAEEEHAEDVVIVDEDERRVRGRSRLRILDDLVSVPDSPDAEMERKQQESLHAPLRTSLLSSSPLLGLSLIPPLRPGMRSSIGCDVPARPELSVLARSQEDAQCPYFINIFPCILPITTPSI
jgi:hypothetical protein